MKRTMTTALLVGLFATAALAVESVNIVGYAPVAAPTGLSMVGSPFVNVAGTNVSIDILLPPDSLVAGLNETASDKIDVWNGSGYDTYFYFAYFGVAPNYYAAWGERFGGGFFDVSEVAIELSPGGAFWLTRPAGVVEPTVTAMGEVVTTDVDIPVNAGLTQVSLPFAADVPLQSAFDSATLTAGLNETASDKIDLWNGSGYDTYFYFAYFGVAPNYYAAWGRRTGGGFFDVEEVSIDIPMGTGFWLTSPSAKTITAVCPY